jgi:prepilin-type processing-associated H-X9-DG protein
LFSVARQRVSVIDVRPGLSIRCRSYSLNGELNYWIIADGEYGLPILQAFHNESQLRRPVMTYGFLDVTAETIDSGIFGMPGPAAQTEEELKRNLLELSHGRWLHLPGERHSGGANVSFLDGHVEGHRWKDELRESSQRNFQHPSQNRRFQSRRAYCRRLSNHCFTRRNAGMAQSV